MSKNILFRCISLAYFVIAALNRDGEVGRRPSRGWQLWRSITVKRIFKKDNRDLLNNQHVCSWTTLSIRIWQDWQQLLSFREIRSGWRFMSTRAVSVWPACLTVRLQLIADHVTKAYQLFNTAVGRLGLSCLGQDVIYYYCIIRLLSVLINRSSSYFITVPYQYVQYLKLKYTRIK